MTGAERRTSADLGRAEGILAELGVSPEEALPTYRLIRQLNPGMEDLAQLQAGQILHLPPGLAPPDARAAEPAQADTRLAEKVPEKATAKTLPLTEGLLGIIQPVISRMKGTVTDRGKYFIPIKGSVQVTIDCSLIPVVERALADAGGLQHPALRAHRHGIEREA